MCRRTCPPGGIGAQLHNVPLGNSRIELEFTRQKDRSHGARALGHRGRFLSGGRRRPRAISLAGTWSRCMNCCCRCSGVELGIPSQLPLPGARTAQLKVVDERRPPIATKWIFEAPGGAEYDLPVRINRPNVQSEGRRDRGSKVRLRFPAGTGYQRAIGDFFMVNLSRFRRFGSALLIVRPAVRRRRPNPSRSTIRFSTTSRKPGRCSRGPTTRWPRRRWIPSFTPIRMDAGRSMFPAAKIIRRIARQLRQDLAPADFAKIELPRAARTIPPNWTSRACSICRTLRGAGRALQ